MEDILALLANSAEEVSEQSLLLTLMSMMLLAGVCAVLFSLFKKIELPPIIGYLLAGILIVNIFNLNNDPNWSATTVSVLKNIGLVMLMFGIGIELSIDKIKKCGKFAAMVAVIQLPLMVLSGYFFGMLLFGLTPIQAITLGAIISGSSTAVVTAVLKTQKRISSEDAETLILVTIVEDIGQVIILSMLTPILATGNMDMDIVSMANLIVTIVIFMVVSVVVGLKLVPRFLDWIGDRTSAEVLLVFSVGLCFMMSWLSKSIGMSSAIGAFLMGVMVSQSKFAEHLREKTEPMKDLFMAVFFISVGMEVTFDGFVNIIPIAIGVALVFMISKFVTVYLGYFIGNKPFEISFVSSISLMAMGEFAFIIAADALSNKVIGHDFYSAVIMAALITMISLPLISKGMYRVVDRVHNDCPKTLARIGGGAYRVRADIYEKIDSSPSAKEVITKGLAKTYISLLAIVVIEIIFSAVSGSAIDFLEKLINSYVTLDNSRVLAYVIVLVVNMILLMIPTWYIITSLKKVNQYVMDGEKWLVDQQEEKDKKRVSRIYQRFRNISTIAIIIAIDLLIITIVPGPLGVGDRTTMLALPLALLIIVLAVIRADRKEKREAKRLEEEANTEEKT